MKKNTLQITMVICIAMVAVCSIVWMVLSTWDWNKLFTLGLENKEEDGGEK